MLYNAQRQRVRDWCPGDVSTCPDCQQSLIARRGEIVVWHWSHHAALSHVIPACGHVETEWHLRWKDAYSHLTGWTVEQAVNGLRIDAANLRTRSLREFIHTLTAKYQFKHSLLATFAFDVRWIFDGYEFVSARKREVSNGGMDRFLTPRAYSLHEILQRRCWVHFDGQLWREWRNNVWYPRDDSAAIKLLAAFAASERKPNPNWQRDSEAWREGA